ncbi:hypothetical protein CSC70_00130 [Pseudoxanthomonas kalamensis DSM 18571]|uniref:hypothetical protein n=1 Tax=Pseudoxanthomonas kalamensis TaxID=289483 RepID=UPI00139084D0|nr:hypothetical protein [Pseudoxanthomonas kalamensis]KAF1711989.1 hypothetical protein CSC70_00130 [Pseudoxanthomonas kalamensis DSM 18571]
MDWLNFFKRKRDPQPVSAPPSEIELEVFLNNFLSEDYLGKAAEAGHRARAAVKEHRLDDAWRFYHEQKSLYMQHAQACNFTGEQTLALDASVSENLANILRIEKKHDDALVHILYCALASRTTKSLQKKLMAYFNRCHFQNIQFTSVEAMMQSETRWTFRKIKDQVQQWRLSTVT